jgi:hypothetical protein
MMSLFCQTKAQNNQKNLQLNKNFFKDARIGSTIYSKIFYNQTMDPALNQNNKKLSNTQHYSNLV